jgi:tRNA A58 N-methylase Trm61
VQNEIYILETGDVAAKRLDHQHILNSENSYRLMEKAGISQGQTIWDIGSGSGAMTEYIANIIGKAGYIYMQMILAQSNWV